MAAIKGSPEFAHKAGVSQSVGEEFVKADKERGRAALRKLPNKVGSKRGKTWRHQGR